VKKLRRAMSIVLVVILLTNTPVFAAEKQESTYKNKKMESILAAPEIKSATYWHTAKYVQSLNDTLAITWKAVDKAKSYEIMIVKANGKMKVYRSSNTCLFVKKTDEDTFSGCPKIYIEKESTWKAATVRVRAVYKRGIRGIWSKSKKITCNALHWREE
jgi:hypothetical protein